MEVYNIYLAGGMSGVPYEIYKPRRNKIKQDLVKYRENNLDSYPYYIYVTDPSDYYNYDNQFHTSEKEVMQFELNRVRNSKLVVVDFFKVNSIGTMAELAIAYEHRIPIIGINECNKELHPWQIEMCDRIFDDMDEAIQFIGDYYLS